MDGPRLCRLISMFSSILPPIKPTHLPPAGPPLRRIQFSLCHSFMHLPSHHHHHLNLFAPINSTHSPSPSSQSHSERRRENQQNAPHLAQKTPSPQQHLTSAKTTPNHRRHYRLDACHHQRQSAPLCAHHQRPTITIPIPIANRRRKRTRNIPPRRSPTHHHPRLPQIAIHSDPTHMERINYVRCGGEDASQYLPSSSITITRVKYG